MKKWFKKVVSVVTMAIMLMTSMGVNALAHEVDYDVDGNIYYGDKYAYMIVDLSDKDIYVGDMALAYANIYSNVKNEYLNIKWKSYNSNIATVTGDGIVAHIYGRSAGETTIKAELYVGTHKADTYTVDIKVSNPQSSYVPVQGISLDVGHCEVPVGTVGKLNATVYPSNATYKGVMWSSNNSNVVRVDDNGSVRAVGPGSAVIVAKTVENGQTAICTVTVTDPNQRRYLPVTAVHVTPSTSTMAVGQFLYASAKVYPDEAANKNVIWNSTNPTVAVVDQTGKITAVGTGSTVINCITVDGGKTDSVYITVVPAAATNNNADYKTSSSNATVTTMPVAAISTRSAELNYKVVSEIVNAPQNGVVLINAQTPMSYDKSVADALAKRPDVTLTCSYPVQGHTYCLALPAGYDLGKQLDKTGYIEWLILAKKPGVAVAQAN